MKTTTFFILTLLFIANSPCFSFNYNISFTASGASTSIDYIIVQNLTQGTTATIPAGGNLEVTAVKQVTSTVESLYVYPNPISNKATITYYSNNGGNTIVNVFGIDGRNLLELEKKLSVGVNEFQLSLPKGAYMVKINENGMLHTAKVLSQSSNSAFIEYTSSQTTSSTHGQKVQMATIPMHYNVGDILLFKAYSGNYVSILSDILTGSKTINFNFVECKDVDGNYYSTVTIGNQVWMAENLKTSKYRTGYNITDKTNLSTWGTSSTEAFSDYSSPSNSTTYGKLYNWYATSYSFNLAPLGWHIPTDAEWTTLSDYLGSLNLAGDKLKEQGNSHWATANATASNITGFTALPGGTRSTDNTIYDIGSIGYWWSASQGTTSTNGWYRSLTNQNGVLTRGYFSKSGGMSVRCIMGDLPIVATSEASALSATSASCGGNVTFDGYLSTTRGVCWSAKSSSPTINDRKTMDGAGKGTFSSVITGLSPDTTYYIRAYAINNMGTAYGIFNIFSTALPVVYTSDISAISATSATSGGGYSLKKGATAVTSCGVCWSTSQNPTIGDNKTDVAVNGSFTGTIRNLTIGTTYYVRAYATNSAGTAYGGQKTFSVTLPTVTTNDITNISTTTAQSGCSIIDNGGSSVTNSGICWSTTMQPTISLSTKANSGTNCYLINLTQNTTYYVRAYATNSIGTAYGNQISFKTDGYPIITYQSITCTNGNAITSQVPTNTGGSVTSNGVNVTTFAGSGVSGSVDGTGTAASFKGPSGVAVDVSGNLYVVDKGNHKIRKITPAGVVSTFAGSGTRGSLNGTGTAASFNYPSGVAVDKSGNLYVADGTVNNMIRKITPTGVVTTFAGSGTSGSVDGTGTAASFNGPSGVAVDVSGNVYVADYFNNKIRKITTAGVVTTLAGSGASGSVDGTGTAARFNYPTGVAVDESGNLYVADCSNHMIRKITTAGVVTTLAGSGAIGSVNGTGAAASFQSPYGVAVDALKNVYVADCANYNIRKITPVGVVTTLAGSITSGLFQNPSGVMIDVYGSLYVADEYHDKISKIIQYGYYISPSLPAGLSFDTLTGVISGTPTEKSPTKIYTVTANNQYGSSTTTLSITVN